MSWLAQWFLLSTSKGGEEGVSGKTFNERSLPEIYFYKVQVVEDLDTNLAVITLNDKWRRRIYTDLPGEGMMDLYTGMQPILDKNRQYRQELWRLKERDEEEDSKLNRVSVAVVGVPNAVRYL